MIFSIHFQQGISAKKAVLKEGDGINPEKAIQIGRSIQKILDGQVPYPPKKRNMVKPLSSLRSMNGSDPATTSLSTHWRPFKKYVTP